MRQLVAGNWKMNGSVALAEALAVALPHPGPDCDLLVCPPHTQLSSVARVLAGSEIMVGGQDCHVAASGAHTGDVAAGMLRDAGATWTILGHSERRRDHAETDGQVRSKVQAAHAARLRTIVCLGETEAQRRANHQFEVVGTQLADSLPDGYKGEVSYEPVWAIGTGRVATAEDVAAMHRFIRDRLRSRFGTEATTIRILYGGSVKPDNAAKLLTIPEVGGALIGGASLEVVSFLAIARAALSSAETPR